MSEKIIVEECCVVCKTSLEEEPYRVSKESYCNACFDEKFFCCSKCGETFLQTIKESVGEEDYCPTCFNQKFVTCIACDDAALRSSAVRRGTQFLCETCYEDNYFTCDNCNSVLHNDDYGEDGYCNDCTSSSDSDREEAPIFSPKTVSCPIAPTMLPLPWTFGFEVEVDWGEDNDRDQDLIEEIREKTAFGMHHDGSLDNGIEFISPHLRGDKGLELLKEFCYIIREAPVRRTCGLHLHLGTEDCSWSDMKKIWLLYQKVELGLYALLPEYRRDNNYCRPQERNSEFIKKIEQIKSKKELIHNLYDYLPKKRLEYKLCKDHHDRFDKRYSGFNLHSHFFRRTLELRYHQGTVAYRKMLHWLILNMALCQTALKASESELAGSSWSSPKQIVEFFREKICAGYPETQDYLLERFEKFNLKEGQ